MQWKAPRLQHVCAAQLQTCTFDLADRRISHTASRRVGDANQLGLDLGPHARDVTMRTLLPASQLHIDAT
jgi:hypothetical protein